MFLSGVGRVNACYPTPGCSYLQRPPSTACARAAAKRTTRSRPHHARLCLVTTTRDQGVQTAFRGKVSTLVAGVVEGMELILWILAVILVVSGIVSLVRGQILWGIVLIVVGLAVGPGGVSILS